MPEVGTAGGGPEWQAAGVLKPKPGPGDWRRACAPAAVRRSLHRPRCSGPSQRACGAGQGQGGRRTPTRVTAPPRQNRGHLKLPPVGLARAPVSRRCVRAGSSRASCRGVGGTGTAAGLRPRAVRKTGCSRPAARPSGHLPAPQQSARLASRVRAPAARRALLSLRARLRHAQEAGLETGRRPAAWGKQAPSTSGRLPVSAALRLALQNHGAVGCAAAGAAHA